MTIFNKYYRREGLLIVVLLSLIIGGVAGGIVGATVSGSLGVFQYAANKKVKPLPNKDFKKLKKNPRPLIP